MKQSMLYIPTAKEVSNQAVAKSHIYALKAGFMQQTAAGIYSYLPLANKIIENIAKIVDEELEKIGCNKITMPLLQPAELWEMSGRWKDYGNELFRLKDRHDRDYALAPTHEEVVTDLVKNYLSSYKKFPVNLYQIGTKMRDELRPRYGFLRGREFIMMDAYSFHTDESSLNETYDLYYQAYKNIFDRLQLEYKIVEADNGSMGGSKSHEFMALAEIGEDTIVYEENNEVSYNLEVAPVYFEKHNEDTNELQLIDTPNITSINQLVKTQNVDVTNICKAVCFADKDNNIIITFSRADRDINVLKLEKLVNNGELHEAPEQLLVENGVVVGFVGPVNLELNNVKVYYDISLNTIVNGICGSNTIDKHYTNYNVTTENLVDITDIKEGEIMFANGQPVKFKRGIELGHIFALGDKYTRSMEVTFLDANQKQQIPLMGCYGIGISRLLSALIEQNHDEKGIIIPQSITPFDIHMIVMDYEKNDDMRKYADELTNKLEECGYKVLVDDRNERPGVKFNDADLIGLPTQVVVGRSFTEDIIEFKQRTDDTRINLSKEQLLIKLKEVINV